MAEAGRIRRGAGLWLARMLMVLAASFTAFVQPAAAQSVLRDAETEALLAFLLGQPAGSNEYKLGALLYTLWFEPPFPTTDNTLIVSVGS